MKLETHRGEVAEHVICSDVELVLQTHREEDTVRLMRVTSGRCSQPGVSA